MGLEASAVISIAVVMQFATSVNSLGLAKPGFLLSMVKAFSDIDGMQKLSSGVESLVSA